jgi:hypothetical protein
VKRYWKLAVLIPLIVLCIGTFYTDASGSNNPEFFLNAKEGNEQEASRVLLQARYKSDTVSISTKGSEYQSEQSFWKSLDSDYYDSNGLKDLAKEYPQFMRGKRYPNAFYIDDRVIGYANIDSPPDFWKGQPDFIIKVSLYDKKQKDSSSFEVRVPKRNVYSFIHLYNVHISGQTMKLFTFNYVKNGHTEVHLYTLDLDKKNLMTDQTILPSRSSDANSLDDIREVSETNDLKQQSDYTVFQVNHHKIGSTTESSESSKTEDTRELLVYDIKRGKLSKIESDSIDELLKETSALEINQTGDDLFLISKDNPKGLRVIRYNLADQKISSDLTIAFKDIQVNKGAVSFSKIENNRLYMLVTTNKDRLAVPTVVIAELNTGRIVYQGVVSRKDDKDLGNLQILTLSLK